MGSSVGMLVRVLHYIAALHHTALFGPFPKSSSLSHSTKCNRDHPRMWANYSGEIVTAFYRSDRSNKALGLSGAREEEG